MTRGIVLMLIGAAVPTTAALVWRQWAQVRQRLRWSRRLIRDRQVVPAAVEWFESNGLVDRLYRPALVNGSRPIPFLRETGASMTGAVDPRHDEFVSVPTTARMEFEVDLETIGKRQRAGAQLWDGTLLYVDKFDGRPDGSRKIVAGTFNYFAYVTFAARLQASLLARGQPRGRLLAESGLTSFPEGVTSPYRPMVLSAVTTCIFDTDDGPKILLAKRSEDVVNALGTVGAIPTFGLESPEIDGERSEYGTVFYNFVKEFIEEVYGQEDLVRAASSEALEPDAIFRSKKARRLINQFNGGTAELRILGSGIDVTDGALVLSLMAHFHSPAFYKEVRMRASAGWEVMRDGGSRPLVFLPASSDGLADVATSTTMSASSLFGVDLMLRHLAQPPSERI